MIDCFEQAEIQPLLLKRKPEVAFCTITSAGYGRYLRLALASLRIWHESADIFVFCFGKAEDSLAAIEEFGATAISCEPLKPASPAIKGILYSASRFIPARSFVLFEADMVFTGSFNLLLSSLAWFDEDSILIKGSPQRRPGVGDSWSGFHLTKNLVMDFGLQSNLYPKHLVSGGLIVLSESALLKIECRIREFGPSAISFVQEESPSCREEGVLNLAVCSSPSWASAREPSLVLLSEQWHFAVSDLEKATRINFVDSGLAVDGINLLHFAGAPGKAIFDEVEEILWKRVEEERKKLAEAPHSGAF